MKKILLTVLVVLVAAVLVLFVAKDTIAKIGVERGVKMVTGLKLTVQKFNLGLMETDVEISDLKLYNPEGFSDRIMLDMPEVYVNYDLGAIMKRKIHLPEMRLDLKEFMVVKNADGELNLDSLKPVEQEKAPEEKPAEPVKKAEVPEIQIDKLKLSIGKVIYKDYSKGGEPQVKEYDINIHEEYSDITDPDKLVNLIVVKALMNTSISRLANFELDRLKSSVSDTLAGAQKVVGDAATGLGSALKKSTTDPKAAVKETTDTIEKTTENLKEAIKIPFGGSKEETE